MDNFLYLKTLFTNPGNRNIDRLSELYANRALLKSAIEELTGGVIHSESVFNKHILVKPNWVNHVRSQTDSICLTTNHNLILALIEVLLPLKPSKITVGDAPIQGCNWGKLHPAFFYEEINTLAKSFKTDILVRDFRRVVFDTAKNNLSVEQNPLSDYIIFDVGKKSFLEPITRSDKNLFRVSQYDHERLAEVHRPGVHKYCISKALFEADMVISMPKVKTHEKAGITAALKNLVGVNGDKDYLPHHRTGGTSRGGDSYPGNNMLRNFAEHLLDIANKKIGKPSFRYWQKLAIEIWRLSSPGKVDQLGAAWHGNDTTWRMVLDLNRIAIFGMQNGQLAESPQRQLFSLCDGIIGGQGNGPLFPEPLPLGFLSFSDNAAMNDYIFALLMKLNPEKLPLLKNAFTLYTANFDNLFLNGKRIKSELLADYSVPALPPPGWEDYLNEG
ncbi:MAG TPA: DUF362 domain-containing protein [Bacteroidales bacterium]|nr:DUF362 domain-containing protein [Bacteroidales bacterium]